jgi:hypothetical protein
MLNYSGVSIRVNFLEAAEMATRHRTKCEFRQPPRVCNFSVKQVCVVASGGCCSRILPTLAPYAALALNTLPFKV